MEKINTVLRIVFVGLIKFYQYFISPLLGPRCRFYPTCSHYALESFRLHPPLKAFALSFARICKCHPLHEGGLDPVPGSQYSPCCHANQKKKVNP